MKKISFIIICSLSIMLFASIMETKKERAEKERFKANQTALLSQVKHWTTESGKNAAEVLKLTLTAKELKATNERLAKTAEDLKIKLNRAKSASTTGTQTEVHVVTQVRDSIVYRDSVTAPVKYFSWRDPWVNVSGIMERDSVDMNVTSVDTLTTIVHKIPHKFWFIKWGCKAIKQTVVSSNPHTKITYNEYIEIK